MENLRDSQTVFPSACPWSYHQVVEDDDFFALPVDVLDDGSLP
jgi:hypothetical protein